MQLCNNSKIISTKNSSKLTHITLSAFIYVLVSINEVCHCLSVVWWKEFNLTRLLHTVDNNGDFAIDGKNLATFHATSDKPSYIQMYQHVFVLSGRKCISLHVYYLVNATGPDVSQQLPAAQWVSSSQGRQLTTSATTSQSRRTSRASNWGRGRTGKWG